MQQSKTCPFERKYVRNLWNVMWRIPRYDFPGIVHLIADEWRIVIWCDDTASFYLIFAILVDRVKYGDGIKCI